MLYNFLFICKSLVIFFFYIDFLKVYDWLVIGILKFVLNLYKIVYVIMKNIKKFKYI